MSPIGSVSRGRPLAASLLLLLLVALGAGPSRAGPAADAYELCTPDERGPSHHHQREATPAASGRARVTIHFDQEGRCSVIETKSEKEAAAGGPPPLVVTYCKLFAGGQELETGTRQTRRFVVQFGAPLVPAKLRVLRRTILGFSLNIFQRACLKPRQLGAIVTIQARVLPGKYKLEFEYSAAGEPQVPSNGPEQAE